MTSFLTITILLHIALFPSKAQESITKRNDTSDQNNQTENKQNLNLSQIATNDQNQHINTSLQIHTKTNDTHNAINEPIIIDNNTFNTNVSQNELSQCYNTQNKTLIQLNKTKTHLENQFILSQQNNTQITKELTHCNHTYHILLSNYTTLNNYKLYLQSNYSKLQKLYNDSKQQHHQLNISYNQLQAAHNKYIYGKCDTQIEMLNNSNTNLQIKIDKTNSEMQALNHRIETLINDYGKCEQKHEFDEQTIQRLEQDNNLTQNKIVELKIEINTCVNDNKYHMEKYKEITKRFKDTQKDYKQCKKERTDLIKGYSLHENNKLKNINIGLNNTFQQTVIALRDSEFKVGELEHELGECNVEWGSCEQKYNMCETATKVLQKDIGQQKKKFVMCNNVTKDCKKKKKEMKDEMKYVKSDLNNCTQTLGDTVENLLRDKCWIVMEYKMDFIYKLFGVFVFVVVLCGVIGYGMIQKLYENIKRLEKGKYELLEISKRMQKERNELEKDMKVVKENVSMYKGKCDGLNKKMAEVQLEKEVLIQERDELIKSNRGKDEQMKQFAHLQIEQQKKQRESVENTMDDDGKNENDNGTDSNGSWSEVSGGNNVQNDESKKTNK